jgi:hypothetical protein
MSPECSQLPRPSVWLARAAVAPCRYYNEHGA